MKYHYTYVVGHPVCGYFYFGVRSSKVPPNEDTKYWGSSKHLKSLRTSIPSGWEKVVLAEHATRFSANEHERDLITDEALAHPACVNRAKGGNAWTEFVMSPEAREKISRGNKGKPKSSAHRTAIATARKTAKKPSLESRLLAGRKAAEARRGKPLSDEHRKNISAAQLGSKRIFTDEHRAALSASKIGKTRPRRLLK